jgi:hypothetical protein
MEESRLESSVQKKIENFRPGMVAHVCHVSMWKKEARGSHVQGPLMLHSETLSQTTKGWVWRSVVE